MTTVRNLLIAVALMIVLVGTAIGAHGHFWLGIAADFAGVAVAIGGKVLSKRLQRPR